MSGPASPYAAFHETAQLLPGEIAAWRRDGHVKPAWRLPTALLLRIQDTLALVLAGPDPVLTLPHVPRDGDEGMAIAREFFDYTTAPELLDLVAAVLGPDLVLWDSALILADALTGDLPAALPIEPPTALGLWIALDDLEVRIAARPPVALEAGQLLVLDDARIHAMPCPRSDGERQAGFHLRYLPASSRFLREHAGEACDARPLWLVRGASRCDANDFNLGHLLW